MRWGFALGSSRLPGMIFALLSILSFSTQDPVELPVLHVGQTVEAWMKPHAPPVSTPALEATDPDGRRGAAIYRLVVDDPGTITVELRSFIFDTYLVLRDAEGGVLAEDDDSLVPGEWDSQLVVDDLAAGAELRLAACDLGASGGPYELRVLAGHPPDITPGDYRRRRLEDAHERVRVVGEVLGANNRGYAAVLGYLGMLLEEDGQYEEAHHTYEMALATYREDPESELSYVATSLHNLAQVLVKMGRYEEAHALFDEAISTFEREVGPEHPSTAHCLKSKATLLLKLGRHEHVGHLYERAAAIQEAAFGPDHIELAHTLNDWAAWMWDVGRREEGKAVLERSLEIHERVLGPDHYDTAKCAVALAEMIGGQGDFAEARRMAEEAVAFVEEGLGPDHPDTAAQIDALADILQRQGDYEGARALYERSLSIRESVYGSDHPSRAGGLSSLAQMLAEQGNHVEARPLYERALAICERALGPDHPATATQLTGLADVLQQEGETERARELYERALVIVEDTYGPRHASTAWSLNSLAALHYGEDRFEEALPLYERALSIREEVLGPAHPDTGTSVNNLALLLQEVGDVERTTSMFERAARIFEEALTSRHPDAAVVRNNLARCLADEGRFDEAWNLTLDSLHWSEDYLERSRTSLTEWELMLAAGDVRYYLEHVLALALRAEIPGVESVAYESLLWWKGWSSRGMLASRERLLADLDAPRREILAELQHTKSRLSDELHRQRIDDVESHAQRLAELRRRRSALERELLGRIEEPRPAARVSIDELRRALPDGSALVDVFVCRDFEPSVRENGVQVRPADWTAPRLFAWVLRSDDTAADDERLVRLSLGDAETVERAVRDYLAAILPGDAAGPERGVTPGPTLGGARTAELGTALRELLWEPIARHLDGVERVIVSPDGFLGAMPLEVLPLADGRFLIEERAFVYLPDAVSLVEIVASAGDELSSPAGRLLAVGGVDYDEGEHLAEPVTRPTFASLRGGFRGEWGPLSFARRELSEVVELSGARNAVVLDGTRATEERLKRELPGARWVHLATHGFFQPDALPSLWEGARDLERDRIRRTPEEKRVSGLMPGLLSGLVCAGANRPPEEGRDNGLLTAEEVTWLDLSRCELVVLSACRTGLGTARGGEGMMGLQRAFRLSGARTVVSSLWSVDDEKTSELMRGFYRRLWVEGRPRGEALRAAQLEVLQRDREEGRAEPWTWGAFVLSGDWR